MSVARLPQLGSQPVALTVNLKKKARKDDQLAKGLQDLYRKGEFADIVLICCEQRFLAHQAVVAAQSRFFREGLAPIPSPGQGMRHEIRLEVANPEAVKIMLDYIYMIDVNDDWKSFSPQTQAINRDVLSLAKQCDLPGLTQQATHWLSEDLTTGNVVERLSICDEFGLTELSEKILEQLTYNKAALSEVANSPQIMNYPKLMQNILQCAACSGEAETPKPKNKRVAEPLQLKDTPPKRRKP